MRNQENNYAVKQPNINTDWFTRKQASLYLQCGISTLDSCISIKKYYIGKSVRYLKSDLDEFLLSNCKEPKLGKKK